MSPSHSRSGLVDQNKAPNDLDFTGPGKGGHRSAVPAAAARPDARTNNVAIASTDDSNGTSDLSETAIFQPGELSDLRDKAVRTVVPGIPKMPATGTPSSRSGPQPSVVAVIKWPSGATIRISPQLNVGRDRRFCLFAAEMASDLHVSREHAVLEICAEGVCVRDLGSRNGTFVDDKMVPSFGAVIVDRDARIRFGPHSVVHLTLLRAQTF